MAKKLTNQQQARLWICRDCDHHQPIEKCGRCERVADVKRVEWLLNFEDAIKQVPEHALQRAQRIADAISADYTTSDNEELKHAYWQACHRAAMDAILETEQSLFAEDTIALRLPIAIRPTAAADGYVITDADDVEHFFYQTDSGKLDYDGECRPICITFAEKKRKTNTHAIKAGK